MTKNLPDAQRKLEFQSLIPFEQFCDDCLKANNGKSHIMLTTNKVNIDVKGCLISNEKIVKLLGVTVDKKISFEL